jgi:hypothetical protein
MEIPNVHVRAHKIISDDYILIFKFDKITLIYNYEIQQLFLFRLHNSTAHLSNVLKLSRSFDTQ